MMAKEVSGKIIRMMKERGWTSYQLAKASGISTSTCYGIKEGRYPNIDTIERICTCFQISLSDFFADEDVARRELSPIQKQAMDGMEKMTLEDQKHLLEYIEFLNKKQ